MPDAYAMIGELDDAVIEQLADAMEQRFRDPVQRAFVDTYLADVPLDGAEVLEIGCGTGAISRRLAVHPGVASVLGVDPAEPLLRRARELAADLPTLNFAHGDGHALDQADAAYDVVVLHTVLCHVRSPQDVLAEAFRVLRPGGTLAMFDGDYATITLATGPDDPLEACAHAMRRYFVHDPWLVRRATALLTEAGFRNLRPRSHGYVQTSPAAYMHTIVVRGADALAANGVVSPEHAAALKAESERRIAAGTFFGHIAYVSIVATKPT